MKKYLIFLIFAGLSSCIDAQTVKETVRGKYGENLGTAETTIRGGKSVTVYKDKFGQITGTSESRTGAFGKTTTVYKDKYGQKTGTSTSLQVVACSHRERLLPLIVTSTGRKRAPAPPSILAILVPPSIEISMDRLSERALLGAGCHAKVPIIATDGAVLNQKVNNQEKLLQKWDQLIYASKSCWLPNVILRHNAHLFISSQS